MGIQPDIVVFMSDQHGGDYTLWGDTPVDTPNLAAMREHGTSFDACYSPCPLCVPARMAFMSGLLPSRTGIFGNNDTLPDLTPCFTHPLVAAGYETVLVGRMHFIGNDQRHGFTKRLAPDITPVTWGRPFARIREQRGRTAAAFADRGATELVGAGQSPVNYYDQMVVDTALDYLSRPHDKPQFILTGTYGPHFPYITTEELYEKYRNRVSLPKGFRWEELPEFVRDNPIMNLRVKDDSMTSQDAMACLAAYLGQIELLDRQIGRIRSAVFEYGRRSGHPVVFIYVSDHGDSCGENRLYGKRNYFDKSAKVPLLLEGTSISPKRVVNHPVSLLDLGPTICSLAGTDFPVGDGTSLAGQLGEDFRPDEDRIVISQMVDQNQGRETASIMMRWHQYKYIHYNTDRGSLMLFDLEHDPAERQNLADTMPELIGWFANQEQAYADFSAMEQLQRDHDRNALWFKTYEQAVGPDDSERWQDNPPCARGRLSIAAVDRIDNLEVHFNPL